MKTLLNVKETYRIDTEAEVKAFIEECKTKAFDEGYTLESYSSTHKEKKSKGDVIDQAYSVNIVKVYDKFWEVGEFE